MFLFNIRSTICLRNQINLPSNEDIQHMFKEFQDNHVISCVDYFFEAERSQYHYIFISIYTETLREYNK
ncbi:unnamed protein product [Rotaria sp. Silwood2]|nr:unnamed protein product [Rotaria sp. Silwood2]